LSGFLPCALSLEPCALCRIPNYIYYLSIFIEMPIYKTGGIKTGELRRFEGGTGNYVPAIKCFADLAGRGCFCGKIKK
jgi:hypothetical protein